VERSDSLHQLLLESEERNKAQGNRTKKRGLSRSALIFVVGARQRAEGRKQKGREF
jgi:hypothetical protein